MPAPSVKQSIAANTERRSPRRLTSCHGSANADLSGAAVVGGGAGVSFRYIESAIITTKKLAALSTNDVVAPNRASTSAADRGADRTRQVECDRVESDGLGDHLARYEVGEERCPGRRTERHAEPEQRDAGDERRRRDVAR